MKEAAQPKVYTIAPEQPFLATLADGLLKRTGGDPLRARDQRACHKPAPRHLDALQRIARSLGTHGRRKPLKGPQHGAPSQRKGQQSRSDHHGGGRPQRPIRQEENLWGGER